jgi:predicted acetyltransferase
VVDLRLRPLRADDELPALAAHAELAPENFDFLLDWSPEDGWSEYLERLRRLRRGDDLPPDRVPATFLVAEVGSEIVGRASIRHELNAFLAELGGHIGYGVRPHHRRRGYAVEILRQSLVVARAEGVERVLVTCDDDNIPSVRVIERLGGVLEDVRAAPGATPKRRYWIG